MNSPSAPAPKVSPSRAGGKNTASPASDIRKELRAWGSGAATPLHPIALEFIAADPKPDPGQPNKIFSAPDNNPIETCSTNLLRFAQSRPSGKRRPILLPSALLHPQL